MQSKSFSFLKNKFRVFRLLGTFVLCFCVFSFSVSASSNITFIPLDVRNFSYLGNNPSQIGSNDLCSVVNSTTFRYTVNFPDGISSGENTFYVPFKLSVMPNSEKLFDFHATVKIGVDTNFYPDYCCINFLYSNLYYSAKNSTSWNFNAVNGSKCTLRDTGYYRVCVFDVYMDSVQLEADCFFFGITCAILTSSTDVIYIEVTDMSYSLRSDSPQNDNVYDSFSSDQSLMDSYNKVEGEIIGSASSSFDTLKSKIFDNSLLSRENNGLLDGFISAGRIFEKFSDIPSIAAVLRYSLMFGIIAFILGIMVMFFRRSGGK